MLNIIKEMFTLFLDKKKPKYKFQPNLTSAFGF